MTSAPERHMIRLDRKPQLFSMRVAALIFQNDHLLVQRGPKDSYWALPGGRAEIGESSEQTIIREIGEELDRDCAVERLLWSAENFFAYDDYAAHELGFYYLISLRQPLPFHESDIVHRVLDGVEVKFRWLPAQSSALLKHDLRPRFIAERIEALPPRDEHLIVREGRSDAAEILKEIV
ncbi:NUDIX hydrolase [Agrobacterium tumefaciens]|jgi:8-oxo-dGTP pyrophosphatase MutT (NUDIX family)|uniref:NUDIX hydrolase n=1 Tax=Agrobacterium tumefaciens TaxID=358 RepID=UPI000DD07128|nr:NUDIX hydrolase [Agrobacterium tumefaciens]MDP9788566.1 8-oxo-dGTP pyrophosphatase MutT (NUDIX family) [Agrobacterium tumefaciens]MDP9856082.1 8-oxo-dGTP pyrophosphatase MutT (NUDIX family) [Agrobacterium tumefaciens]